MFKLIYSGVMDESVPGNLVELRISMDLEKQWGCFGINEVCMEACEVV